MTTTAHDPSVHPVDCDECIRLVDVVVALHEHSASAQTPEGRTRFADRERVNKARKAASDYSLGTEDSGTVPFRHEPGERGLLMEPELSESSAAVTPKRDDETVLTVAPDGSITGPLVPSGGPARLVYPEGGLPLWPDTETGD